MTTRHYRSPITCGCREPGNVARQLLVNSASGNTSPNRSRTVTGNGGSRRRYAARPAATTSGAGSGHDRGCTDIGIHHPTAGDGEEPTAARSSSPTPVRRIKTRRRQQPGPDRAFDRCLRPWPVERTVVEPVHHVIAVDGRQRGQCPRVGVEQATRAALACVEPGRLRRADHRVIVEVGPAHRGHHRVTTGSGPGRRRYPATLRGALPLSCCCRSGGGRGAGP